MLKRKMPLKLLSIIFITQLLILPLIACGSLSEEVTVNVGLINSTNEAYNLWIGHAEMDPQNLVEAGGMRFWGATMNTSGEDKDGLNELNDQITVNAGKNGKVVSTQKLSVKKRYTKGMSFNIAWDGSNFKIQ